MKNQKLTLSETAYMILGCILMSVSLNMFFEPHSIAPGGLTGLAIVINKVFPIPLWTINLVFNVP
ncbi:MAG: YitT family protein, partial [Romboutsia sp.]|uniref:YitT family protein n=1 Tax=Romboutsia sp. TaxID=1965302 RepID=UPI003F2ED78B